MVDIHYWPIASWKPIHGAIAEPASTDAVQLGEGTAFDWHMLRVEDPRFDLARIILEFVAEPVDGGDSDLIVYHWGDKIVVRIRRDGTAADADLADDVSVVRLPSGGLRVRVEFVSFHRSVSIGLWKSGSRFRGTGKFQWRISETSISPQSTPAMAEDERICVLDIGARDGLSPNWERLGALVRPVLVEPDPVEAARLTQRYRDVPGSVVLQQGLAESAGRRTLHVTRLPHCSSLLEPNDELLSRWTCAGWFAVEATAEIDCASYAELVERRVAPNPDVVKIDVQGYEFEVLQGMGSALDHCLAVELEAHVLPIYKNQRLLGDIVGLLDARGMSLRKLRPVGNFNGDLVEFDAVFIRRLDAGIKADPVRRRKLARTELLLGS